MDWSLLMCGARGHVTYAPDEPAIRARMAAGALDGEAWRCLRCGTFVPGGPDGSGPAAAAPQIRRGSELRSALILRFFAVERFVRAIIAAALAYALWRFRYSRVSIEQEFQQDLLPVLRTLMSALGYNVHRSRLLGVIQHAFALDARTLTWLALGAAGYALIEILEGVGLWLLRRWGEYFAMIATSAGIPYEIYDLTAKVTVVRLAAFAINVALVVYLVATKRLFGVRGGKEAYEARLRSESVLYSGGAAGTPAEVTQPAAAQPSAAQPSAAQPSGAQPSAAQPAAAQPSAAANEAGSGGIASSQAGADPDGMASGREAASRPAPAVPGSPAGQEE